MTLLKRLFWFVMWLAVLWHLWQALTVGCIAIGKGTPPLHCFDEAPIAFLFDLTLVLFCVVAFPFLVFGNYAEPDVQKGTDTGRDSTAENTE